MQSRSSRCTRHGWLRLFLLATAPLASCIVGIVPMASAQVTANSVTWTVVGATFNDGGTLTGSFTLDLASDILSWDLMTAGGDPSFLGLGGNTYSSSSPGIVVAQSGRTDSGGWVYGFFANAGPFKLIFATPSFLPPTGGSLDLAGNVTEFDVLYERTAVSGELTTSPPVVPEISSITMVILAFSSFLASRLWRGQRILVRQA